MKLYTRRGDQGSTDLFGGTSTSKDSLRVVAYGAVDELNSCIGLAASACEDMQLSAIMRQIQSRLFEVGADLATPGSQPDRQSVQERIPRVEPQQIQEVEQHIDALCNSLAPIRSFILPGGSELASRLHLARTVCRRAERQCVTLMHAESMGSEVIAYLNRLSDLLFAMARKANQLTKCEDVPWIPQRGEP